MVIVATPVALDTGVNCRLPTVCGCKYETTGFGMRAALSENAVIVRAWSSLAGPGLIPDNGTTTGPLSSGRVRSGTDARVGGSFTAFTFTSRDWSVAKPLGSATVRTTNPLPN